MNDNTVQWFVLACLRWYPVPPSLAAEFVLEGYTVRLARKDELK